MRTIDSLVPIMIKHTEEGSLSWTQAQPPRSGFVTSIKNYGVYVWEWKDMETEREGFSVSISDANGEMLDRLVADEYSARYAKLEELFMAARRRALGIDKVLDEIAAALEDKAF